MDEENDCFGCGHCDRCIERSMDFAEEMSNEPIHCCLECGCDLDQFEDVICSKCEEDLGME